MHGASNRDKSFVPAAQQLVSLPGNNNRSAAQWADHHLNTEWADNSQDSNIFISDTGKHPE